MGTGQRLTDTGELPVEAVLELSLSREAIGVTGTPKRYPRRGTVSM